MKIIYGKDSCVLQGNNITDVVIHYRGIPYLSLKHLEIISVLNDNQAQVKNISSKSLLLHGNNQIHIGFIPSVDGELQLFRYTGYFKILSAKVNGDNVTIETKNIDYCELINSKFDNMGKPEQYRGTYRNGVGVKRVSKGIRRASKSGKLTKVANTTTGGY